MDKEISPGIHLDRTQSTARTISVNGHLHAIILSGPWRCIVDETMAAARNLHTAAVVVVDVLLGNPYGDSVISHWRENGESCSEQGTPFREEFPNLDPADPLYWWSEETRRAALGNGR